ncbi:helix-turn-helix transcriptional regulator [Cryptosporangium japonicum]
MARESSEHNPAPRVCAHCGGRLRRDNTNTLCDPCQRSAHTVELLAPVLPLDFWAEPEMRAALADHDLGKVSQLYRARTPIRRQHMVAELVGFSQAHISRIERGLCEIRLDTVLRFVQGLRIPPHLVDPIGAPYLDGSTAPELPTTVPTHAGHEVGDNMRRRSVLKGLTGAAALVGFSLAGDEDEEALANDDFGRVGEAHAAQLEDAPKHLYNLDYRYGGDTLCDQAAAQLRRANKLLNRGQYSEKVGQRLQVATGELGICAGWLAFDAGRQDQARYCYTEALAAARMANDANLEVHALANMSMQAVALDRPREGLHMAQAAQRVAAKISTPTMDSLLAMREARAWAKLNDGPAARKAMARAHDAFQKRSDDEEKPVWIAFFDEIELAGNEGMCELDTGRANKAASFLELARGKQREGMVRNKSLYTVRLAFATLARRDVTRAIEIGEEALGMVVNEVTSTRTLNELRAFRRQLAQVSTSTAARTFMARFDSTVVA